MNKNSKTNFLLQVLVEYDDVEWQRREWICVYKEGLFSLFMVEQGLSWVDRRDPYTSSHAKILWPAHVSFLFFPFFQKFLFTHQYSN